MSTPCVRIVFVSSRLAHVVDMDRLPVEDSATDSPEPRLIGPGFADSEYWAVTP